MVARRFVMPRVLRATEAIVGVSLSEGGATITLGFRPRFLGTLGISADTSVSGNGLGSFGGLILGVFATFGTLRGFRDFSGRGDFGVFGVFGGFSSLNT